MGAPESSATIKFPASLIDSEIRKELEEYGVNFKEADLREQEHELDLEETIMGDLEAEIEDGIFRLHDSSARYGEFEGFETMLIEKEIPFDRRSSMDWDRPPTLRVYRPKKMDLNIPLDADADEPVVSVQAIREVASMGIMGAVKNYLDEHFPAYPPLTDWVKGSA